MTVILRALAVTAELTGTELSKAAMQAMEHDLAKHPQEAVLKALERVRREVRHRMTLADVLERLEALDGRPGADEAWALAVQGFDEYATVVLCGEIANAMAVARPIFAEGDKVGARMAFRAAYDREVAEAREAGRPVEWWPSVGFDVAGREPALKAAVETGLLTAERVAGLLPAPVTPTAVALLTSDAAPMSDEDRQRIRGMLAGMLKLGAK